jgi:hypothetical protein
MDWRSTSAACLGKADAVTVSIGTPTADVGVETTAMTGAAPDDPKTKAKSKRQRKPTTLVLILQEGWD